MKNPFEELQNAWKESRQDINTDQQQIDALISRAASKYRSNKFFYYGNIAVLSLTLLILIFAWQQWMPFREVLSNLGISLMIGILSLRIIIEIFSALKAKGVDFTDSTVRANQERIDYYNFRKVVHGRITISMVIVYLVGYLMTLPELSGYLSTWLIVIFTVAFFISGLFIIYKVRQRIRQELENLEFFVNIDNYLRG